MEANIVFLVLSSQFHISIVVERPDGREIAKPVELRVMVGDANDNRPTFPQAQYHTVVKELAARGNGQVIETFLTYKVQVTQLSVNSRIFCFYIREVILSPAVSSSFHEKNNLANCVLKVLNIIQHLFLFLIVGEVKNHHKSMWWLIPCHINYIMGILFHTKVEEGTLARWKGWECQKPFVKADWDFCQDTGEITLTPTHAHKKHTVCCPSIKAFFVDALKRLILGNELSRTIC